MSGESRDSATVNCPRCASTYVERMPTAARDEGDELTADASTGREEPPNMRCNACGHTWWIASSGRR